MQNKDRKLGTDFEADFLDKVRSRPKLNPINSKSESEPISGQIMPDASDEAIPIDMDIKNMPEISGFEDYKEIFLNRKEHNISKRISIEKSVHFKMSLIVAITGDKRFNISTYVNNILTDHFQRFDHVYKAIIEKHIKP